MARTAAVEAAIARWRVEDAAIRCWRQVGIAALVAERWDVRCPTCRRVHTAFIARWDPQRWEMRLAARFPAVGIHGTGRDWDRLNWPIRCRLRRAGLDDLRSYFCSRACRRAYVEETWAWRRAAGQLKALRRAIRDLGTASDTP